MARALRTVLAAGIRETAPRPLKPFASCAMGSLFPTRPMAEVGGCTSLPGLGGVAGVHTYAAYAGSASTAARPPGARSFSSKVDVGDGHALNYTRAPDSPHQPSSSEAERPVVMIVAWMQAQPKHVARYEVMYHKCGVDTLTVYPKPVHVLSPDAGLKLAKSVLETLDSDARFDSRPLVIHSFSVGGYFTANMLHHMRHQMPYADFKMRQESDESGDATRHHYDGVRARVAAEIVDSPVDFEGVPRGLPDSISRQPLLNAMLRIGVSTLLNVRRDATRKHRIASQHYHWNDLPAPSLWFYSDADTLGAPDRCEEVMAKWGSLGRDVSGHRFEKSKHVQHYRDHPEQYEDAVVALLKRVGVVASPTTTS